MRALYDLVHKQQWQIAIAHIQFFADGDAVDQIFYQGYNGSTAIMIACDSSAPLELVQLMITKAKLDPRKRCLLAIADSDGWTALHYAAQCHSDPAVLKLFIREHPLALSATDSSGSTPHPPRPPRRDHLPPRRHHRRPRRKRQRRPRRQRSRLRVSPPLPRLALLGRPHRRPHLAPALHQHPDLPVTQTEPLDLLLAHARLCKDVWSVILEFV